MTDTENILSRYQPREGDWPAWCYERPDGTVATCFGGSKALLRFDGNLIGVEPSKYDNADNSGYPRKPSGRAIDNIFKQSGTIELSATVEEWVALEGEIKLPVHTVVKCDECDGTGTAECPHCEQDMDCEQCDGTGKVDGEELPTPRYVLVNGTTWFDTRIVCPILRVVDSGPMVMHFAGNDKPSKFIGDGWEMLAMPISHLVPDEEIERLYWPAGSEPK